MKRKPTLKNNPYTQLKKWAKKQARKSKNRKCIKVTKASYSV